MSADPCFTCQLPDCDDTSPACALHSRAVTLTGPLSTDHDPLLDIIEAAGSANRLAAQLGVRRSTVLRWTAGGRPGPEMTQALAELAGLDPADLARDLERHRHRPTTKAQRRAATDRLLASATEQPTEHLAVQVGVKPAAIRRWRNGVTPSLRDYRRVLDYLARA